MDPVTVEPADVDVRVMQVETESKPIRWLGNVCREVYKDDGLRCGWLYRQPALSFHSSSRPSALDVWKTGDYGRTTEPIGEGELRLPRGTYVVVKEVTDRSYTTEELDPGLPVSGVRVVFEALHPRDPYSRISFARWDSLPQHNVVEKVEHDMTVIAIAATGL